MRIPISHAEPTVVVDGVADTEEDENGGQDGGTRRKSEKSVSEIINDWSLMRISDGLWYCGRDMTLVDQIVTPPVVECHRRCSKNAHHQRTYARLPILPNSADISGHLDPIPDVSSLP